MTDAEAEFEHRLQEILDKAFEAGAEGERQRIANAIVAWAESPETMERRPELWESPGLLGAILRDFQDVLRVDLDAVRLTEEADRIYEANRTMRYAELDEETP